ncbi:MAG TPA: hypothetical protein VFP08_07205 [Acidimicrobiales bacterium]|nr:hypothetical protein [Acidimicrobiales bacterium]
MDSSPHHPPEESVMYNHPDVLHQLVADRHRQAVQVAEAADVRRRHRQVKRAGRRHGR